MFLLTPPHKQRLYKFSGDLYTNFDLRVIRTANLDAWWKGDAGVSLDSSNNTISIPQWTSCEGNNFSFYQNNKAAQPRPSQLQGVPALQFSEAGWWFISNYTAQLQDYTMFLVYEQLPIYQGPVYGSQYRRVLDKAYDTGFFLSTWEQGDVSSSVNFITYEILGNYGTNTPLVANKPRLLTLMRSGGVIILQNYQSTIYAIYRGSAAFSSVPLYMGFSYYGDVQNPGFGSQGGHFNNMIVAELAIYSASLASSEIAAIQRGLIDKYSTTA